MRQSVLLLLTLLTIHAAATAVFAEEPVFAEERAPGNRVSFARDVAPLLARQCLECHGPDAAQREAGLRLDARQAATARLASGSTAVVPGDPSRSELVRRITARGEERMPPPETGDGLTKEDVQTLVAWIQQGATWESHWAFTPPRRPSLPQVQQQAWVSSPIDRFILAELEQANLAPLAEADRRTLIRRVYYDLLGLPPTPRQVSEFLRDARPDAWEQLVDRLLASPLHGQRWGRHWLDVARYADSNGGDENHAYPLAWRYRDYVIGAFNQDLAFDNFVQEQIAGDLLSQLSSELPTDAARPRPLLPGAGRGERLTATGFLALGAKILAERDKVKMRADLVDEQIDTLGKSLLALSLGCARCHDHKFDPIPATDYYALAGIFHSTQLVEQPVATSAWRQQKSAYEARLAMLDAEKIKIQQQLETTAGETIDRQAEDFDRGNVSAIREGYGEGIGIISDPGSQQNFAEYDITPSAAGQYLIQLRYAALNARPGRLLIDGKVVREKAIAKVTGGWMPQHQRWFSEGAHPLRAGNNVLRIESAPMMSHIDRLRLIRYENGSEIARSLERLEQLDGQIATLQQNPPRPVKVMAAGEGDAQDVRLHLRGSHLALGDKVPRGFPGLVSARQDSAADSKFQISASQSGRLQLARWITDPESGAGGQAARVIANRIWHWHFGRGLVDTPDNFGIQGRRPTHPQLLDWLATELIEDNWSLKSLHRQILLSATYRQRSTPHPHRLYRGTPRRRLEAEVIRDSLLFHAGRLDCALVGEPPRVKSQDPSPDDLKRNETVYRNSRRRSVYLPVVRSNVYRFLTLFDFPNAAEPVGRRDKTTVPTQALLLLNDPFVMQQAEHLARSLLETPGLDSDQQRISEVYQRLFSRPPTSAEQLALLEFLREFQASDASGQSRRQNAWASLCHTLILSSEFLYVE